MSGQFINPALRLLPFIGTSVLGAIVLTAARHVPHIIDNRYLQHHQYQTSLRLLVPDLNRWVLLLAVSLWAAVTVYTLCNRLSPALRRAVRVGLCISAAAPGIFTITRSLAAKISDPTAMAVLAAVISVFWLPVVVSAVLIMAGCLTLRYLRRKNGSARSKNPVSVWRTYRKALEQGVSRFISARRLHTGLVVIVLMLNACQGAYKVLGDHALRNRPNIVMIVLDTTRADHLGCYGYPYRTTPNIDRFAQAATRYENAISQAPYTPWSVASFMTSRHPEGFNTSDHWSLLSLAEALSERNYATGAVVANPFLSDRDGFSQGFDTYDLHPGQLDVSSPTVVDRSLAWIKQNSSRKFFMLTYLMDPHSPYVHHDGYDFPGYAPSLPKRIEPSKSGKESPRSHKHMVSLYDSELAFTDEHVGRFLEGLKAQNLYDDTLIVIVADHGEEFLDHGGYFHGMTLYKELLNVPLIIKLPHQREGKVVSSNAPLISLFPSIMHWLGYSTRKLRQEGQALDLGPESGASQYIFSASEWVVKLRGVQTTEYKYVWDMDSSRGRLYDLQEDPLELSDVSVSSPLETKRFHDVLMKHEQSIDGLSPHTPRHAVDADGPDRDRLRSLGYLQ